MKINTILALLGVILAVICLVPMVHIAWLLPVAVILIGMAYLVSPN